MPTMSGGGITWSMFKRPISSLLIFTFVLFFSIDLARGASYRNRRATNQRSSTSVKLNGRIKEHHGEAEICPLLSHCKCHSRGSGLDITCERVNSYKLKVSSERVLKESENQYSKLNDHQKLALLNGV